MNAKNIKRLDKHTAVRTATTTFGGIGLALTSATPCFAAPDILSNLETLITTYYSKISGIAIGGGLLCAVVAILIMVVSPSDRGSETGKRWLIRILLGIALLLSIGGIYTLIQSMTGDTQLDIENVMKNID